MTTFLKDIVIKMQKQWFKNHSFYMNPGLKSVSFMTPFTLYL